MAERYPDDAVLLALSEDTATGVEYIETGRSPYFLEFRRLVQRLLLSLGRANDLRVYQDGDLSVGVRAGRVYVGGVSRVYAGAGGVAVGVNDTTHVWLDSGGVLQSGVAGLPADRTGFVPLAEVVTDGVAITQITDLRGELFLLVPDLGLLGVQATAGEINQALSGVAGTVDAAALSALTAGPVSTADSEHRHLQVLQDADAEAYFTLLNDSNGAGSNVALVMSLPNKLADDTVLVVNRDNGYLSQRYNGVEYNLVGAVHTQYLHGGDLVASVAGGLLGSVPVDGVVVDVVLSVGSNLDTDVGSDHVAATVKVNGVAVTSTDPRLRDSDGVGFRSTSQGDGVAGVIKSDGTEQVVRGDVLTVDLTRAVAGVVTAEASDVVVLVVIRAAQPE